MHIGERGVSEIKFFKNKFFLILLTISLIIAAVCTVFYVTDMEFLISDAASAVCYPFEKLAVWAGDGISGFSEYFSGMDSLIRENRELREQVDDLERQLDSQKFAKKENKKLREYIGIYGGDVSYKFIDAAVISQGSDNYATVINLDKGSFDGVETGMAVVNADGVIGYISSVGKFSCKVVTIIETATSVGVYIPGSGAAGILYGTYENRNSGTCEAKYFAAGSDISPGDILVTSGSGSVYPRGLTVGEVTEVTLDNYSRTMTAKIKPKVNFMNIGKVMIISGFEENSPEETAEAEG